MKIERNREEFRPITLTIETQKDLNDLIDALNLASRETGSSNVEAFCDGLVSDLRKA